MNRFSSHSLSAPPAVQRSHARVIQAAATLPISHVTDSYTVKGNAAIKRLPALAAGVIVMARFTGTPTLTHSAKLVCQGGANVTLAAGDVVFFSSRGDGIWATYVLRATGKSTASIVAADISDSGATGRTVVQAATAVAAQSAVGVREVLTALRNYYVRTDGSDSNTGLANTAGAALLTIQAAVNKALNTLDTAGNDVVINIADGTYAGAVSVRQRMVGGGTLYLQGNSTTPDNVLISVTGADAITIANGAKVELFGMKAQTATSGAGVNILTGADVGLHKVNFGACVSGCLQVGVGALCIIWDNFTVAGNSLYFLHVPSQGFLTTAAITITLTGTPAFGAYTVGASGCGVADLRSVTWSGSATGARFVVHQGSQILPATASLTWIPGNSAGTEGSGGVYFMSETAINHNLDITGSLTVSADVTFAGSAWTSFTPTFTASSGTITTVGTITAGYKRHGKIVYWRCRVTFTTIGTAAGRLIMTLPGVTSTGAPSCGAVAGWHESLFKGANGAYNFDAAEKTSITASDGTFPITGNGQTLNLGGFYEAL